MEGLNTQDIWWGSSHSYDVWMVFLKISLWIFFLSFPWLQYWYPGPTQMALPMDKSPWFLLLETDQVLMVSSPWNRSFPTLLINKIVIQVNENFLFFTSLSTLSILRVSLVDFMCGILFHYTFPFTYDYKKWKKIFIDYTHFLFIITIHVGLIPQYFIGVFSFKYILWSLSISYSFTLWHYFLFIIVSIFSFKKAS